MACTLIVISEPKGGTSSNLFEELVGVISGHRAVQVVQPERPAGSGLLRLWRIMRINVHAMRVSLGTDTLVLHVYLVKWLPLILMAKLMRRRIVVFQWDVYPITLAGRRINQRMSRRVADATENLLLRLADRLIVPSADFLPHVASRGKTPAIIPLWPQKSLPIRAHSSVPVDNGPVNIGFAGQINATRGLSEFVDHLAAQSDHPVHLHLFSGSAIEGLLAELPGRVVVTHHGHLSRDALQNAFRGMHFGLICLSPKLDQPGYPSKTYDYLAAGLPLIYFGKGLPAFTTPLVDAGLAVALSPAVRFNPATEYLALSADFDIRRAKYLADHQLEWTTLADIL